jgi:hypothetical protein
MAPDLWNTTTSSLCSPCRCSYREIITITPTRHQDITAGWCDNHYFCTVTTRSYQEKIQKILKRMKNEMCKRGWVNYTPYYFIPLLKPIELRGVRLEGRGWGNRK